MPCDDPPLSRDPSHHALEYWPPQKSGSVIPISLFGK